MGPQATILKRLVFNQDPSKEFIWVDASESGHDILEIWVNRKF